jgi:hypothetical protein
VADALAMATKLWASAGRGRSAATSKVEYAPLYLRLNPPVKQAAWDPLIPGAKVALELFPWRPWELFPWSKGEWGRSTGLLRPRKPDLDRTRSSARAVSVLHCCRRKLALAPNLADRSEGALRRAIQASLER